MMGGFLKCYGKKKRGKCLWQSIQALDLEIEEKKKRYRFLQNQKEMIESWFQKKQVTQLITYPLTLWDGLNGEASYSTYEKKEAESNRLICPYQTYGCEAIYQLKKNVLSYHQERMLACLKDFNELVRIILAMRCWHKKSLEWESKNRISALEEKLIFLHLEKNDLFYLGYYYGSIKIGGDDLSYPLVLFYPQDHFTLLSKTIYFNIKEEGEILDGTCLASLNSNQWFIQIQLVPNEEHNHLLWPIAKCIATMIEQLNISLKKQRIQFVGSYIEVTNWSEEYKRKLITMLKPLGYQVIGKMKNGQFEEEQLVIRRKNTKSYIYKN